MNDSIALLIAIFIGIALLSGFFATVGIFFPKPVIGAQRVIQASPGRAFVIGLVNLLFFGLLALASFAMGDQSGFPMLALPGVMIFAALLIALCFGLTALVEHVGERGASTFGGLRRTLIGTAVVGLGCALPFIGWFLLLPYLALLALGAEIVHLMSAWRNRRAG